MNRSRAYKRTDVKRVNLTALRDRTLEFGNAGSEPRSTAGRSFQGHFQARRLSLVIIGGEPLVDHAPMAELVNGLTAMPTVERDSLGSGLDFSVRRVDCSRLLVVQRKDRNKRRLVFMFGFPADSARPADGGGQDGTILEERNSQLTGAVAVFHFLLGKHNLLASPNLLETMCLKEALGERSTDRRGDGRNAQPSLFPRPDADRTAQRIKESTNSRPRLIR